MNKITELELIIPENQTELIPIQGGWKNKITNTTEKYKFKSLGCIDVYNRSYSDSDLFPRDSVVELTEGLFPLDNYLDLCKHTKKYHTIGGKKVNLVCFSDDCNLRNIQFNKYDNPHIEVELAE